jgi:hypothetical protein
MITVSWFSAGVSSAVATKLAIGHIDRIVYQHIDDQHADTLRFVRDCEKWFGEPIEIIQSPLKSVENACLFRSYVNGVRGASCTRMLKRELRKQWESDNGFFSRFKYVWGMDKNEQDRADKLILNMPNSDHEFPLIDSAISKQEAHAILRNAGIDRPKMYDLGYPNNNCVGCVKGGMGYWNKIRVDFPLVFLARSEMERKIGGTCLNGIYLDELDPDKGRGLKPIVEDCGAFCVSLIMEEPS